MELDRIEKQNGRKIKEKEFGEKLYTGKQND